MAPKTMHSGNILGVYAIIAPKVDNVNVRFILPRGFALPTFRGKSCGWHVIEVDEDGFIFADERKKLKTRYTMRGTDRCCASGKWGELGMDHDVDLKLGDVPPQEFSNSILVNKSNVQPGV